MQSLKQIQIIENTVFSDCIDLLRSAGSDQERLAVCLFASHELSTRLYNQVLSERAEIEYEKQQSYGLF